MCLLIVNPSGVELPRSSLENGWMKNYDGAGYMFAHNGELHIRKGFDSLHSLEVAIDADRAIAPMATMVIHFRYATHGNVDADNCHPFPVCGGKIGLAHNGVLWDFVPPTGESLSDTAWFCKTVLAYRSPSHVMDDNFRAVLADMIGSGNKFVLLDYQGKLSIVNESAGIWDSGNWYSNNGFRYVPRIASKDTAKMRYTGETDWRVDDLKKEIADYDYMIDRVGWYGLDENEQSDYVELCRELATLDKDSLALYDD